MQTPFHNRASHGADAFRYLFQSFKEEKVKPTEKRTKRVRSAEQ